MLFLRKELLFLLLCVCLITRVGAQEPLKILVPLKLSFREFVSWDYDNRSSFWGFSVDVFRRCVAKLPYGLDYELVGFGDGVSDPSYSDMVQMLVAKEADGIVADITITEERMRLVDFTQPYIQSSLVMVVPFHYAGAGQLWSFLQPFGAELWASIGTIFVATGVVIFILENDNPLFRGEDLEWRTCAANIFWFTSMTLFFCHSHNISTRLGRLLTVFWLMVVLIFTSAYTASLTSILSAEKPAPTIQSYDDLWRSNLQVGYQKGSFTGDYIKNSLEIRPFSRLVELDNEKEYTSGLELGPNEKDGVAAILAESPYTESFLKSECRYTKSGNDIAYFGGFGFAFQKNSSLVNEFSLAIVSLSKNRELQDLKERYLGSGKCIKMHANNYIPIENFGGLFIIIGAVYSLCVSLKILGWILAALHSRRLIVRSLRSVSPDEVRMHPIHEEGDVKVASRERRNDLEEQK